MYLHVSTNVTHKCNFAFLDNHNKITQENKVTLVRNMELSMELHSTYLELHEFTVGATSY